MPSIALDGATLKQEHHAMVGPAGADIPFVGCIERGLGCREVPTHRVGKRESPMEMSELENR